MAKKETKKESKKNTTNNSPIRGAIKLFISAFVCGAIAIAMLFASQIAQERTALSYGENLSVVYGVELKKNNFYEKDYLTSEDNIQSYVANLIKNIDLHYYYDFHSSQELNGSATLKIVADLSIKDAESKGNFFTKSYVLMDPKTIDIKDAKDANFDQIVSINYDEYNSIVNDFKTFGVSTVSDLKVSMYVDKNINTEKYHDNNINKSQVVTMTIPLSKRAIDIKLENQQVKYNHEIAQSNIIEGKVLAGYILSGIFAVIMVVFIIDAIVKINVHKEEQNAYDKKLKRILNEYDRLIVTSSTAPDLSKFNVRNVANFEELLDAHDSLQRPIDFYEKTEHSMAYFYVHIDKDLYLFKLSKKVAEEE